MTVDGVEQSRDVFNNSTYNMTPTYVKVGTAGNVTQGLKDAIASQDVDAIRKAAADAAKGIDSAKTDELTDQAKAAADAAYAEALAQGLDTTTAMKKAQEAANAAVAGGGNTEASSSSASSSQSAESESAGNTDGTTADSQTQQSDGASESQNAGGEP